MIGDVNRLGTHTDATTLDNVESRPAIHGCTWYKVEASISIKITPSGLPLLKLVSL
jgi:hypothetical protein